MIKLYQFRLAFLFLAMLSTTALFAAQGVGNPKRIQLKAGTPAVILEGEVTKNKDVIYVFSAKAGQKFSGRITKKDGNTGFEVTDPDGQGLPEEEQDFNTTLKGSLEKTGDYRIAVSTFEVRASKYTLAVRITDR
jgi:hypothetical protein